MVRWFWGKSSGDEKEKGEEESRNLLEKVWHRAQLKASDFDSVLSVSEKTLKHFKSKILVKDKWDTLPIPPSPPATKKKITKQQNSQGVFTFQQVKITIRILW